MSPKDELILWLVKRCSVVCCDFCVYYHYHDGGCKARKGVEDSLTTYYGRMTTELTGCKARKGVEDRTSCARGMLQYVRANMYGDKRTNEQREKYNAYQRQYRLKQSRQRKAAGLCITCGKPAVEGRVRCEKCLAKYAEKQRISYARKKWEKEAGHDE